MVPTSIARLQFYSDDFLFVPIIPYLSEDEYFNIYDLLAHLHTRGVNWCLQILLDTPYLDELYLILNSLFSQLLLPKRENHFPISILLPTLRSKLIKNLQTMLALLAVALFATKVALSPIFFLCNNSCWSWWFSVLQRLDQRHP